MYLFSIIFENLIVVISKVVVKLINLDSEIGTIVVTVIVAIRINLKFNRLKYKFDIIYN